MRSIRLARPKSRLQVPLPPHGLIMKFAIETSDDRYELAVVQDEIARGIVAIDQNRNRLKRYG
jgi:hypothetical protein